MKRIFLFPAAAIIAGAVCSQAVYAQAAEDRPPLKLTLEECLERTLGDNYTRQSVQLNESSSEAGLSQSKMERLPDLSASLGESVSNTSADGTAWNGNYNLSANMTVYQGGQIGSTIKQNELQYEQTKLQTRKYDNDLAIQVLQAFLTALGNEELLKYQEALVTASREQAAEGKARFAAGQILESDYLLLEAQYATDLNNIVSTRISLSNSLVALKSLMAAELSQKVELVYPDDSALERMLVLPAQGDVVARGMETLPDVRISEYNVEIAETGVRISRLGFFPTVSLNAGVGTGHYRNFRDFGNQLSDNLTPQAGVSVSIPIFSRNRNRANVTRSRIALRQAELENRQSLLDIEQTLISEYGNVVASESRYEASVISRNAYESSFNAYREMFRLGAITAVELLQQQNNYISAMNDYIQNKYTFMLQRKVLDVYMGYPITM